MFSKTSVCLLGVTIIGRNYRIDSRHERGPIRPFSLILTAPGRHFLVRVDARFRSSRTMEFYRLKAILTLKTIHAVQITYLTWREFEPALN